MCPSGRVLVPISTLKTALLQGSPASLWCQKALISESHSLPHDGPVCSGADDLLSEL